jgi:5-methylcytosine-specific restriction endonuclease McrA
VANGHADLRKPKDRCDGCGTDLTGKLVSALYCNRKCKQRAAEKRRDRDNAARYIEERERRIAYALSYAKRKPEVGQATKNRRKARKRNAGVFQVSGADWLRLCVRYRFCCAYCRQRKPLTMDHVIPLSRGGRHSLGNLLPACASCNSSKSSRFITEWRAQARRR